jgi:hypothetical protein
MRLEKRLAVNASTFGSGAKEKHGMSSKSAVTRPRTLKAKMQPAELDLGFRWGPLNSMLLAGAALVLAAGYLSLAKGSITLAPVLLVTGYCVLIPASLLLRGNSPEAGE